MQYRAIFIPFDEIKVKHDVTNEINSFDSCKLALPPMAVKSNGKKPRLTPSVSRQRCNPRNVSHSFSISNHFAPHDLPSLHCPRIYIYIYIRNRTFPPSYGFYRTPHESSRRTFSLHYLRVYSLDPQELNNTAIVELVVISLHSPFPSNRLSRNFHESFPSPRVSFFFPFLEKRWKRGKLEEFESKIDDKLGGRF